MELQDPVMKTTDKKNLTCKWCEEDTPPHVGPECDNCWELRLRLERNPQLARKILAAIESNQKEYTE